MRTIRSSRWVFGGLGTMALCMAMGCKNNSEDKSSLYVFDGNTNTIQVWDDVAALNGAPATTPTRTIQSGVFANFGLAWGGMTCDRYNNLIYLVSKSGKIARISRANGQSGEVSSGEVVTFSATSTASGEVPALATSQFGQIAVDGMGRLYLTEGSSQGGRVWLLSDAATRVTSPKESEVSFIQPSSSQLCTGVAIANTVFSFFGNGGSIPNGSDPVCNGPRIYLGTTQNVIASSNPLIYTQANTLGTVGNLAIDTNNNYLFLCHRNTTGSAPITSNIVAYCFGDIKPNAQPTQIFNGISSARTIAHAGSRPWLAALDGDANDNGTNSLHLWQNPTEANPDSRHVTVTLAAGTQALGVAFGD